MFLNHYFYLATHLKNIFSYSIHVLLILYFNELKKPISGCACIIESLYKKLPLYEISNRNRFDGSENMYVHICVHVIIT